MFKKVSNCGVTGMVSKGEEMAKRANNLRCLGIRVRVFKGLSKKVLGFGYLIGFTDVWVINMPDGSIRSLKDAEKRPSNRAFKRSGGVSLEKVRKNPKIRLDNGSIVYGCQVWWGLVNIEN